MTMRAPAEILFPAWVTLSEHYRVIFRERRRRSRKINPAVAESALAIENHYRVPAGVHGIHCLRLTDSGPIQSRTPTRTRPRSPPQVIAWGHTAGSRKGRSVGGFLGIILIRTSTVVVTRQQLKNRSRPREKESNY